MGTCHNRMRYQYAKEFLVSDISPRPLLTSTWQLFLQSPKGSCLISLRLNHFISLAYLSPHFRLATETIPNTETELWFLWFLSPPFPLSLMRPICLTFDIFAHVSSTSYLTHLLLWYNVKKNRWQLYLSNSP